MDEGIFSFHEDDNLVTKWSQVYSGDRTPFKSKRLTGIDLRGAQLPVTGVRREKLQAMKTTACLIFWLDGFPIIAGDQ
jgi:hypothetical protein